MEEYREERDNGNGTFGAPGGVNRWLVIAVIALLAVAGVALGYGYRQQILVGHLTAQESVADATIKQMQDQLNAVNTKLNDMTTAQAQAQQAQTQAQAQPEAPAQAAVNESGKKPSATTRGGTRRAGVTDKRYKQLQAQLAAQQKELKDTQDMVAKNRADLEGNISSTRDELNGSIAKTHEELVALEKRGERNYTEFDLMKAKQFQRVGPVTLSLRKADTKHKSYDLEMIVDDNQLSKKKVNLYEPIWIHTENDSQPIQVVVNRIEKNLIHGYVSAPKYKPSELAATGASSITPVSAHVQTDSNSGSQAQPSSNQTPQ